MTALSCPACGLQQTLAAPRCARCGARLDAPAPPPFVPASSTASQVPDEPVVDDRTVLRDALPVPPADALPPPPVSPSADDHSVTMPDQFGANPSAPSQPSLTWTPGGPPPKLTEPSRLQRIWRRIIGEPAAPTQGPPGGAPTE